MYKFSTLDFWVRPIFILLQLYIKESNLAFVLYLCCSFFALHLAIWLTYWFPFPRFWSLLILLLSNQSSPASSTENFIRYETCIFYITQAFPVHFLCLDIVSTFLPFVMLIASIFMLFISVSVLKFLLTHFDFCFLTLKLADLCVL